MILADKSETEHVELGRLIEFDERSRSFNIAPEVRELPLRSKDWTMESLLNQQQEGACVGAGIIHDAIAKPAEYKEFTMETARELYWLAQDRFDPWQGGMRPNSKGPFYEGTSVLAGLKAAQFLGIIHSYRWSFTFRDTLLALGYKGPVVSGLWMREGMMNPDAKGFIHPTGNRKGGHCMLINKVNIREEYIGGPNSWGTIWGDKGYWKMTFKEAEAAINDQGEIAIPRRWSRRLLS